MGMLDAFDLAGTTDFVNIFEDDDEDDVEVDGDSFFDGAFLEDTTTFLDDM